MSDPKCLYDVQGCCPHNVTDLKAQLAEKEKAFKTAVEEMRQATTIACNRDRQLVESGIKLESAREALEKYGNHTKDCALMKYRHLDCNCGYVAALKGRKT